MTFPLLKTGPNSTGRRFGLFLVFSFLLVGGYSLAWAGEQAPQERDTVSQQEEIEAKQEDDRSTQNGGKGEESREGSRESISILPKIKILHGSPATVIDLTNILEDERFTEIGENWSAEIIKNKKKKVVDPKVENGQLILTWGKVGKSELIINFTSSDTQKIFACSQQVEVWEPDWQKLAFAVIGGLGIFLLGMKSMSEGVQAIAGNGLRRMISFATDNRLMATGVGTVVTTLVQSSSITTVMVVGFVSSEFMTLSQAIGVIMGANIGTTVTGWIIALKIGKYGLPLAGIGVFGYLFIKNDRIRFTALALMGLGMVFLGLELMKDGFKVVRELPSFEAWFQMFTASDFSGIFYCVLVGCILTFIVQSSSATLGITITLAVVGVIDFRTAAALVLGENIGTTVTALLASIGATTNAKRAAYFHVIFNLLGVFWVVSLFYVFIPFVDEFLVPNGAGFVEYMTGQSMTDPTTGEINIGARIASVHTCFNLLNTLMFLPFTGLFARLLERFVPSKLEKEKPHLSSLDIRMLETPVLAIEQSRNEILRMAEGCEKMMGWLPQIVADTKNQTALIKKAFHREEVLDTIQDEVTAFVTEVLSGNAPLEITKEAQRQLHVADEFESVSDYIVVLLKSHMKLNEEGFVLDGEEGKALGELHNRIEEYVKMIIDAHANREDSIVTKARSQGTEISHKTREIRKAFLEKMASQKVAPPICVAFIAQINAYRKIKDHALEIAEALAE
ncbi:MAG: Na/Pi cotransporter family protein [Pirellulaceae bacterium]|nr:Na/Pi cotransporter family protein [Pirellulaceae bacterium]